MSCELSSSEFAEARSTQSQPPLPPGPISHQRGRGGSDGVKRTQTNCIRKMPPVITSQENRCDLFQNIFWIFVFLSRRPASLFFFFDLKINVFFLSHELTNLPPCCCLLGKRQAPVFDVFEAFLNTDNIQVFANAATDYIMCLMKFVKGLGTLHSS